MIQLFTFGRLELQAAGGQDVRPVLAQPRRAALLVWLATQQPRGYQRRDAALALFWPELDQEHARAALRKAIHHVRRCIGEEALEGRGDDELRVNPQLLWCDASAFEAALDDGNAAAAMELYQGPFLDAFFVADAPGFEQWMERERARLHRRAFDAAWTLAERAERAGNTFEAAHWGRRSAVLAPDDEAAIRRLMELLSRLGDRAGAVQVYEDLMRHLRDDLDVEPSDETQRLARKIRQTASSGRQSGQDDAFSAPIPDAPVPIPGRRRPAIWAAAAAAGLAVTSLIVALTMADEPAMPNTIAVFPFQISGDSSLQYLSEGMSSLLGTGLDGAGELRSVDHHAVAGPPVDAADAGKRAAELGAGWFVVGDVVAGGPHRLRINATLHRRNQRRSIGIAAAEGPSDSLFALVDAIAAQIIVAQRGDSARSVARLAAMTTHSLPALKAYLEGEAEFRRGRFPQSVTGFQKAVALDSTFALAHYRLAASYSWFGSEAEAAASAARAAALRSRLPVADRELVEAYLRYHAGDAEQAERHYREILRRRPEELDALYNLGEVLFHYNPHRGRLASEARPFFERARALNHGDAPLIHLLEIAALERDTVAFDSLMPRVQPASHFWLTGLMVSAFTRGTARDQANAEAELRRASPLDLVQAASHTLYLMPEGEGSARVIALLLEAGRPPAARLFGQLLGAHAHLAAGRWRAADSVLRSAARMDPARAALHAGLLFATPTLPVPAEAIGYWRERLAAPLPAPRGGELVPAMEAGDIEMLRRYVLGLVEARLGRDAAALRLADEIRAGPGADSALRSSWAAGIRAGVAVQAGDHAAAERALRGVAVVLPGRNLIGHTPFPGLRYERFLRGEAAAGAGRAEEAAGWYDAFREHSPFALAYLVPGTLRRAELLERLGRTDDAAAAYRAALRMWHDADPEFQPLLARARLVSGGR